MPWWRGVVPVATDALLVFVYVGSVAEASTSSPEDVEGDVMNARACLEVECGVEGMGEGELGEGVRARMAL